MNPWNGAEAARSETGSAGEAELGRVLDAYLAALESGAPADPEALAAAHPEIADRLRACISVLNLTSLVAGAEPVRDAAAGVRLGDFVLIAPIGRGGMGIVFEARQISLGRRVALKALPFAAALDPLRLGRFQVEARAAAQLHHTNIVPIFSVGCERGVHFYAMQLIEGRTLAVLIRELRDESESSGPGSNPALPRGAARYRMVAELGVQAAEALEHAHRQGIVHRDVKPSNLMVDVRNNLWITDFGLARMDDDGGLTAQGDILGTLRYMSPEQSSGDPSRVDHRTDVYSLGATLYELATLRPLHAGRDRDELLQRRAEGDPPRPRSWDRSIPRDLETIILRALSRDREHRYATARDLADDLRRFLDGRPIFARRPRLWKRAERWARRHKALSASLAFALLLSVVGGAVIASLAARNRDLDRINRHGEYALASLAFRTHGLDRFQRHAEYVLDVGRAGQYVERNKLAEAVEVLKRHIPATGADDERSFPWHYLWRLCHVRPQQLKGHDGDVYHVEYSPDGKTLATAGQDGTARIWDASTGSPLRTFRGHQGDVDCATFSPDGETLATCGDDGTVRLWNALDETGPSVVLGREEKEVVSVVFTPDGRTLISGGRLGKVRFWNLDDGRETRSIQAHARDLQGMAISPDGRLLATACEAGGVKYWNLETNREEVQAAGVQEKSYSVAFSHDGTMTASANDLGPVGLASIGRRTERLLEGDHTLQGVAFSPDDRTVAGCGNEGCLCLWDVATGRRYRNYRTGRARLWGVAFSPDGRKLAACGADGAVEIWDADDVQEQAHLPLPFPLVRSIRPVAVRDAIMMVYERRKEFFLLTWGLRDGKPISERAIEAWYLIGGVISPDGTKIATCRLGRADPYEIIDLRTGERSSILDVPEGLRPTIQDDGKIQMAFSHDDAQLAVACSGEGAVWDLAAGRCWALPPSPQLGGLPFVAGENLIAVSLGDHLAGWDSRTSTPQPSMRLGLPWPIAMAFSSGDRRVHVAYDPGGRSIARVDLAAGTIDATIPNPPTDVTCLAVSPDGKTLACGGPDGAVTLRDEATFELILTLEGCRRPIQQLEFTPDGSTLFALAYSMEGDSSPLEAAAWTTRPSTEPAIRRPDFAGR